jgi:hypothetical protein
MSDEDFKQEMLDLKTQMSRFVEVANQKFDGLISDVRSNGFRIDKMEARFDRMDARFDRVEEKLDTMSNQFKAVTKKVFENEDILKDVESRVSVLESEAH